MKYALTLTEEDGGYVVTSPDLPIVTEGDSLQHALDMASDAIDEALAGYMADGDDIPLPTSKGKHYASPSLRMTLRVQLYTEMRKQKITPVGLAKRIGWPHAQAYRLFKPTVKTDIGQFELAFAALGKHIELRVS